MAIIKCKMCGGDLWITPEMTVARCEYCGSRQTIPTVDSEKKTALFLRANKLRFDCDFDRAAGIYDSILSDFPAEAEAWWGLVLCKYGIEYVTDPASGKKVPTCRRSSFQSVLEDENFTHVMECADAVARRLYREEAIRIEELRKGILEVSAKEAPYDIFLCYKETAEDGGRTLDSVLAQDVYDALTARGYRVFFSRVTLEDRLGQEYEPYIFAALNSAKVMLAFGTDYEHFNAVWVKNEWSRFLQLMVQDRGKHLIPCFKNLGPYDMPPEFAKLQAQDLGKVGAIQDLMRGIEKLFGKDTQTAASPSAVVSAGSGFNMDALLQRGFMALEDQRWQDAATFFDRVLDMDARRSEAYLGKAMVDFKVTSLNQLAEGLCAPHNPPQAEYLLAGEPDQSAEWQIIGPNTVPRFYEERDIRKLLAFDFRYPSKVAGWKRQQQRVLSIWDSNSNLARGIQYSGENQRADLLKCRDIISKTYDDAIGEACREEDLIRQDILSLYRGHLARCREKARTDSAAAFQRQKRTRLGVIAAAAGAVLLVCAVILGTSLASKSRRDSARQQLIGNTYSGVYTYSCKYFTSKDYVTLTVLDDTYCNVTVRSTYDPRASAYNQEERDETTTYVNVPYTVSGGIYGMEFMWERYQYSDPSENAVKEGPADPFEILEMDGRLVLSSENWGSQTPITLR